jgi:aspartyl-tRNA synthetase
LGGMLTSLENPIVEAWKIKLDGDFDTIKQFVADYMDSPDAAEFRDNSDGAPGFFLFDPRRPLEGLQAFGFEGAEQLKSLYAHAAGLHHPGSCERSSHRRFHHARKNPTCLL